MQVADQGWEKSIDLVKRHRHVKQIITVHVVVVVDDVVDVALQLGGGVEELGLFYGGRVCSGGWVYVEELVIKRLRSIECILRLLLHQEVHLYSRQEHQHQMEAQLPREPILLEVLFHRVEGQSVSFFVHYAVHFFDFGVDDVYRVFEEIVFKLDLLLFAVLYGRSSQVRLSTYELIATVTFD